MLDQADDLRRMANEHSRSQSARAGRRTTLLAITGGKGGVGTTTSAVSISTGLSQIGRRAILVDACPNGGDVALHCGVEGRHTLADVLVGRRTWPEVIQNGPRGLKVVAGSRWSDVLGQRDRPTADAIVGLLQDPAIEADVIVLDVGNNPGRVGMELIRAADAVILVTTSDPAAVMGSFKMIKSMVEERRRFWAFDGAATAQPVHLLVGRAASPDEAASVRHRLARTCRRMLGIDLLSTDLSGEGLGMIGPAALFARFPRIGAATLPLPEYLGAVPEIR